MAKKTSLTSAASRKAELDKIDAHLSSPVTGSVTKKRGRPKKFKEKMTRFPFMVPVTLKDEFSDACDANNTNMSSVLRDSMQKYVRKNS